MSSEATAAAGVEARSFDLPKDNSGMLPSGSQRRGRAYISDETRGRDATPVKHAGKSRSQLTSSYNHATARNTAKKAHFLPMTNSPPLLPLTGRQTWVVRDITIVRRLSGCWIGAVILRGFSTMDS